VEPGRYGHDSGGVEMTLLSSSRSVFRIEIK
jgi:hypothetical protein